MAHSTVAAFKAALLTQLQARSGLSGVQVTYGWPSGALQRESIMLGHVQVTQEFRVIGRPDRKMEEYDVTVHITVIREGAGQQQAADERSLALLAELEGELQSNATMNNTVLTATVGAYTLEPMANENTRQATLTATIHVQARL